MMTATLYLLHQSFPDILQRTIQWETNPKVSKKRKCLKCPCKTTQVTTQAVQKVERATAEKLGLEMIAENSSEGMVQTWHGTVVHSRHRMVLGRVTIPGWITVLGRVRVIGRGAVTTAKARSPTIDNCVGWAKMTSSLEVISSEVRWRCPVQTFQRHHLHYR